MQQQNEIQERSTRKVTQSILNVIRSNDGETTKDELYEELGKKKEIYPEDIQYTLNKIMKAGIVYEPVHDKYRLIE